MTRAVGVGLHSGQRVELTLRPAAPDTGIVFRRIDLAHPVDIPVGALSVTDTRLASTIEAQGAKVHTVEHVLAALAGAGIDNAIIELDANEPPIADGSSREFVRLVKEAGRVAQGLRHLVGLGAPPVDEKELYPLLPQGGGVLGHGLVVDPLGASHLDHVHKLTSPAKRLALGVKPREVQAQGLGPAHADV